MGRVLEGAVLADDEGVAQLVEDGPLVEDLEPLGLVDVERLREALQGELGARRLGRGRCARRRRAAGAGARATAAGRARARGGPGRGAPRALRCDEDRAEGAGAEDGADGVVLELGPRHLLERLEDLLGHRGVAADAPVDGGQRQGRLDEDRGRHGRGGGRAAAADRGRAAEPGAAGGPAAAAAARGLRRRRAVVPSCCPREVPTLDRGPRGFVVEDLKRATAGADSECGGGAEVYGVLEWEERTGRGFFWIVACAGWPGVLPRTRAREPDG